MSWWNRFDRWLMGVEAKGFKVANKLHVYTINMILIGLAYGTYTLFRDYNEFFKAGRDPNYGLEEDEDDLPEILERDRSSGGSGRL